MQRCSIFIACFLILTVSQGNTQSVARADNSVKGPERWESVITQFEALDAAKPPAKGNVLLIGGSNARRWRDVDNYFPDHQITNRGFGGARLYEILHYFDRLVLPHQPRIIVLNAGGNDMNAGRSLEEIQESARLFMQQVRTKLPDTRVLYIGLPYLLRAKERPEMLPALKQFNKTIAELAQKEERLQFIDIFPAFLDDDGQPRSELFVQDGIHFTANAYAILASMLNKEL